MPGRPDPGTPETAPADPPRPPETPPAGRPGARVQVARVAGLIAVAAVAGLIHPRALAAVAVVAAVLVTGFVYPWLGVRGVRAHWTFPVPRGQVGQPLAARVTLRSVSPWPVFGLVARGGWADPAGPGDDPVTAAVPKVPALGVREAVVTVIPDRRGVFPAHLPTLSSAFPFGLREARRPAGAAGRVVVWPEVVPLTAGGRAPGGVGGGAVVRSPLAGQQGEFAGTRPYRAGEPLHRIHWKQSARHDQLIVLEASATARRAGLVVVETAPDVHARHAGGDSLERALSVGASLAAGLADAGVQVTLVFSTGRVFSALNRPQLAPALDAMARLDAAGAAGLDDLLARLPPRVARGAVPCVVTTVAGWRRAAGRPGRRRFVVIDERDPGEVARAHRPAGLPRGVPLVPLDDPGHRRLHDAWKEVAGGADGLV